MSFLGAPLLGAVALGLLVAGCAERAPYGAQLSSNQPYAYKEDANDPQRFQQTPQAGEVDEQLLQDTLLYRAAEVTLDNGMEGFRIVEEETDPDRRHSTGFRGGGGYGQGFGYAFAPVSWHRSNSLAGPRGDNGRAVQRYGAYARIQMFEQAPAVSGEDGIHDARHILRELSKPSASDAS